ncbi:MAG: hypothetical protein WCI65_12170 [Synechococcaceae cyanobacterium ELA263]
MPTPCHPAPAYRPSDAELLDDAAWYHLIEAATDASEAARNLIALANKHSDKGLTPGQAQHLHSLGETALSVANQSRRMLGELTG